MDSATSNFNFDTLIDSNFPEGRQKVGLVPAFRELEDHITNHPENLSDYKLSTCAKIDSKETAIIESKFSDENLEHMR